MAGIEHFWFYDCAPKVTPTHYDVAKPLIDAGLVTYHLLRERTCPKGKKNCVEEAWDQWEPCRQGWVKCFAEHANSSVWIAQIDPDEILHFTQASGLTNIHALLWNLTNKVASVRIPWKYAYPEGVFTTPTTQLRAEVFPRLCRGTELTPKSIWQPRYVKSTANPHYPTLHPLPKGMVKVKNFHFRGTPVSWIHYRCRSIEELRNKRRITAEMFRCYYESVLLAFSLQGFFAFCIHMQCLLLCVSRLSLSCMCSLVFLFPRFHFQTVFHCFLCFVCFLCLILFALSLDFCFLSTLSSARMHTCMHTHTGCHDMFADCFPLEEDPVTQQQIPLIRAALTHYYPRWDVDGFPFYEYELPASALAKLETVCENDLWNYLEPKFKAQCAFNEDAFLQDYPEFKEQELHPLYQFMHLGATQAKFLTDVHKQQHRASYWIDCKSDLATSSSSSSSELERGAASSASAKEEQEASSAAGEEEAVEESSESASEEEEEQEEETSSVAEEEAVEEASSAVGNDEKSVEETSSAAEEEAGEEQSSASGTDEESVEEASSAADDDEEKETEAASESTAEAGELEASTQRHAVSVTLDQYPPILSANTINYKIKGVGEFPFFLTACVIETAGWHALAEFFIRVCMCCCAPLCVCSFTPSLVLSLLCSVAFFISFCFLPCMLCAVLLARILVSCVLMCRVIWQALSTFGFMIVLPR